MKTKITALILAAVLCFGALSGCGNSAPTATEAPAATETPAVTEEPVATEAVTDTAEKYTAAFAKYEPDQIVMTVNGQDVTWTDYFYWIYSMATQIESSAGTVDWAADLDGTYTFGSYALFCAEQMVSQYWVLEQKEDEFGIVLSEEDKATIDKVYQEDVTNYGGGDEEAFQEYLATYFIPIDLYNRMSSISTRYLSLFSHFYGSNGADLSDADAVAYAENAGYLHAKHILFSTVDTDGNALDEAAAAEKLASAQAVLAQLQSCTTNAELETKFDELMKENTEDTGYAFYPDGYYFTPGEMVETFESATTAMDDYGLSDIVESDYGYHIILRLPLEADGVVDTNGYTIRYYAATDLFDNMCQEWFDAAEIVYTPEFENLDMVELFSK